MGIALGISSFLRIMLGVIRFFLLMSVLTLIFYTLHRGHVKVAIALISKILRRKGIYITFIVAQHVYGRVKNELELRLEVDELEKLIR